MNRRSIGRWFQRIKLPGSPSLLFLAGALALGPVAAWAAAAKPVLFNYLTLLILVGLSMFTLSLVACLLVLRARRARQRYSLSGDKLVRLDGASFAAWFTAHNLIWSICSGLAVMFLLVLFGPTTWVAVLASGLVACMVYPLPGALGNLRLATLGLCWTDRAPEGVAGGYLERADVTMVLSKRFAHAVAADQTGALGEIARTLDLAKVSGVDRAPNLWENGFASFGREWKHRGSILGPLFAAGAVLALLLFVALPQLNVLPDYSELVQSAQEQSVARMEQELRNRPEQRDARKELQQPRNGENGDRAAEDPNAEKQAQSSNGDSGQEGAGQQGQGQQQPGPGDPSDQGAEGDQGSNGERPGDVGTPAETDGGGQNQSDSAQNQQGPGAQSDEQGQGKGAGKDKDNGKPGEGDQEGEGEAGKGRGEEPGQGPSSPGESEKEGPGEGEGDSAESDQPGQRGKSQGQNPSLSQGRGDADAEPVPRDDQRGWGEGDTGPEMGGGEGVSGDFPPSGDQLVTVELPPLQRKSNKAGSKQAEERKPGRASGRATSADIANTAGRTRQAADNKKPIQNLPNWILALFPQKNSEKRSDKP
ncbi:MAG: hypothetical protein QNK37_16195 [Acidobacteriota bacterium]|nr:hypothetical protein [Acidobacteriota bacterium]